MTKAMWAVVACVTMLCAGAAVGSPTAQEKCNNARVLAWKKYQACVNGVVAKDAKGYVFDEWAAFAKCRHKYFGTWTKFQTTGPLAGTTCIGTRYTDNSDQTVTDNLTDLVWEKKDSLDSVTNFANPHDADNGYAWSTGAPYKENGAAFTGVPGLLNAGGGFAGANGWRLPTLTELQTIALDFPCRGVGGSPSCFCPSTPCVDPALDAANTQAADYWSSSTLTTFPGDAWTVYFVSGNVYYAFKPAFLYYVRAVRGGM